MTTAASTSGPASSGSQSLAVALGSVATVALAAALFKQLQLPTELAVSLAGSSASLVPLISLRVTQGRKTAKQRIAEAAEGEFHRPPMTICLSAAGMILFAEFVAFSLTTIAILSTLKHVNFTGIVPPAEEFTAADRDQLWTTVTDDFGVSILLAALAVAPTMAFVAWISLWAARRIRSAQYAWVVGAVFLAELLSGVLEVTFEFIHEGEAFEDASLWWIFLLSALLYTGPALIGAWWARRTQVRFLAGRLLAELTPSDREAALELLGCASITGRL